MTNRICNVPGCPEPPHCKGYCRPHYMRNYHYGDPLGGGPIGRYIRHTPESFWAQVDKNGPNIAGRPDLGPCWPWTGKLDIGGYGLCGSDGRRRLRTHRYSWETANARKVSEGLELDHLCHTLSTTCPGGKCEHRKCVNPDHLEPVTHHENARRSTRATKPNCPKGHPLVVVGTNRLGNPKRECRTCLAARQAENRRRRRAG